MIVELSLNEKCGMWFLGEPRAKPKIAFTYASPGPISIDFTKLAKQEQEHVLRGIQDRRIDCATEFVELYQIYTNMYAKAPEPSQEVTQYLQATETQKKKEQAVNELKKRIKKEADTDKRCEALIKLSVRAIKNTLGKESDVRVLRKVRALELEKGKTKARKSVLDFLQERITKLTIESQAQIIKDIEKSSNAEPAVDPKNPYDKIVYEVEEDDEEIIKFALGDPI